MILDTAFVLDLLDGDEGATAKAEQVEAESVVLKIPAMTVLELYIGIGTGVVSEEEEERIRRVIEDLPSVPMTEDVSRRAGRLLGESGSTRGKGDAAIAATADVEDFERLGVTVETY